MRQEPPKARKISAHLAGFNKGGVVADLDETLRRTIRDCAKRLDGYGSMGSKPLNEANTKSGLIEPTLQALGWDIHDPDEVNREYRRQSSDKPVDYALLLLGKPRLLVEAKRVA